MIVINACNLLLKMYNHIHLFMLKKLRICVKQILNTGNSNYVYSTMKTATAISVT